MANALEWFEAAKEAYKKCKEEMGYDSESVTTPSTWG